MTVDASEGVAYMDDPSGIYVHAMTVAAIEPWLTKPTGFKGPDWELPLFEDCFGTFWEAELPPDPGLPGSDLAGAHEVRGANNRASKTNQMIP